ncbi:Ig-like domain-containing protein [Paenibacillus oryzisoli]|uniref:Ig-like domain-containing protein n=1 Tax=Paenibacillus oryzisoli TaxID=1850517 RepID=UPI003D2B9953
MKNNGIKRLISAALSVFLMLGVIGFSPFGSVAAAAAPTANYNQFQVKLTADPVTDAAPVGSPNGFGTTGSAGRIWTDKSVTVESDGSFGVKLSTLAQEYVTVNSQNPGVGGSSGNTPAADVTFVLDMSTSMNGQDVNQTPGSSTKYRRVEAMAMAANDAIRTVMDANPNNRVAVYWFGGAATSNHLGTMMPLNHYDLSSGQKYLIYGTGDYSITPNSNLGVSATKVSLAGGTPTQDGIMYGISSTLNALGTRSTGPKRQPYVFILSDGAAINAKKAWYTSPKDNKSFDNDYLGALSDATTISNYNRPSNSNDYVPPSGTASITAGDPEVAALTILTGAYMKKIVGGAYTTYNGESTEAKFYTVGLGTESAINGTSSAVYAWAGLDPKTLNDNKTTSSFRNGTAVATYGKLAPYATSGPGGIDYTNAFVYSNYYTFASSYDLLSGAFNGMASDVEASTTILPLLDIPAGGGLGGSETAEIASAIVFVDEIGDGFAVDTSTLKIGDAVATVDTSLSITGGTAYKFAGYGSKAVIQTVDGVTSLTWYIDSADMQPHIYRFTNRTSPVAGEYTAPTNGSFALNYKVKPAFTASPADSALNLAYYLNSGSAGGGAKTAAYFTPPADSPYYAGLTSTRTITKTGGIGANYVTEESLSGNKVTMKLGNNGKLGLEMGIIKTGPATAPLNGTINYTVKVYNYTDTDKTGLSVISEAQTQSGITVPANGSKELTFSTTAPGTTGPITSGTAVISGINLASNTVITDVTNVNAPPTAAAQSVDVNQNTAKAITLGVADDLTAVNDLIYVVPASTAPAHGTLSQDTVDKNKWNYTPTTGYAGPDSFTYKVTDAGGLSSSEATITITVNGAPTAADQTVQVGKNTAKAITLSVTDDLTAVNNLIYVVPATTAPAHGSLTQDATDKNKWTYTPTAEYTGSDSFTYKVTDAGGLSSSEATITITVNGAPTAADQSIAVNQGTSKEITLGVTDDLTAVNSLIYTVPATTAPSHGTLAQDETDKNKWTYTPTTGYAGPDSFTYKVTDAGGLSSSEATITITVNGVPTAAAQSVVVNKNTAKTITLGVTDDLTAVNNLIYTVPATTAPAHGTLTQDETDKNKWIYTPTAGYTGPDSFTYKVTDAGGLASSEATITITVNGVPTAADQTVQVVKDTAKVITLDVTDDLTAVNNLIYTVPATTAPAHGTLTQDATDKNKWTYTPSAGYVGPDSFTYKVTDAGGLSSSEATVTIAMNGAPTAAGQSVDVNQNTPKAITLGVTDDLTAVNALIYTVPATTAPAHGTLTQDATVKNKWTYTPSAGYTGSDSFTYKVTDEGNLSSSEATVTIIVNGPPVAVGQDVKTNKGVAKPIMLIGMDDLSSVTGVVYHLPGTTQQGGTLTQVGTSGAVIYTPAPGYIGPDSFTFTITDEGGLESNPAVVNLTVNGSPTASGNTFETSENVILSNQVAGTDPNGDSLSYHLLTQAGHGTVTMDTYGGGAFTYVPDVDYTGEDSFTFKVMDEDGLESEPVTVTITILKSLDGWVGNNGLGVTNPPVIVGAGDPLKLSAISSIFATTAKATITYKILNATNMLVDQIDTVDLAVNPAGTTLVSTQWTNVNYRLNDKAVTGSYTVTYATYKQGNLFQTEPGDRLADNHFSVVTNINLVGTVQRDEETGPDLPLAGAKVTLYDPTGLNKVAETTTDANGGYRFEGIATKKYLIEVGKQGYTSKKRVFNALPTTTGQTEIRQDFLLVNFGLGLTATPTAIVGDGNTTSVLKAVITDRNGNPIPNIEVVFDAQDGTFPSGTTAMTNANGVASVVFKSAKIEGILSQLVPVTATVNDDANGLHDTAQILITFEPASVVGQVTNTTTTNGHASSSVLAGVPIKLTADFDGDGIIDFSAETVTDSDGKYSIAVPRGDKPYHLEVIRTENIGGVATPVSYQQTANVGIVTGAGNENFKSEKTATGIVLFKQQDGTEEGKSSLPSSDLKNSMKVYVKKSDGTYIEDSPGHPKSFALLNQGVFNVEGLAVNEAYTLDFAYEVSPGKEIVLSHRTVQVAADGEMNITQELIDPYGKVTDAVANNPIAGAHVVLYYAGTTTGVVLPGIAGFAPNNNASPDQYTDASGDYAYMVFPDTDYKLVVSKDGYYTKTIDNIHVGKDIVKQDFTLDPIPPSDGTPSVPAPTNVTLNLSVDKNLVQEGENSTIAVDYTNPTATTIKDGKITVTVPDGANIVDADGGTVDGNTITWPVTDLPVGQASSHHIVVKWPQLSTKDADFDLQGKFTVGGNGVNAVKASSTVRVKVFSDRFNHLQHQRYILGYPDGTFKTNNALTRAELAAIVARLTENVKIDAPLTFRDVSETHWAANYIKIVTKHGFFNGFEDGTFHPEAPVTRAELASVMVRFLKLNVGVTGDYHFTDVQGHWAAQAIEELYREKFLAGYPDGTFKPAANITRVEAVTLINRMLYRGPLTGISPLFPDVSSTYWGFGDIMEASISHESTRNADGSEAWLNKIADDVQ